MRAQPVTAAGLVEHVVRLVTVNDPARRYRVLIDGAPPTGTSTLADALVGPLRAAGRPVARVRAEDFLRPASLRLEHGRYDADAFYDDRLDVAALAREVVDPFGPDGSGRYLPTLWDSGRDRATRAPRLDAAPGAVLILDGSLLLGRWLDVDLTVHLATSLGALNRRLPASEHWTLPAYARYGDEVGPETTADVVVRADDPRHLALRIS